MNLKFRGRFRLGALEEQQGFAVEKTQHRIVGRHGESPLRSLEGFFNRACLPFDSHRSLGPGGGHRGRPVAVRGHAPGPEQAQKGKDGSAYAEEIFLPSLGGMLFALPFPGADQAGHEENRPDGSDAVARNVHESVEAEGQHGRGSGGAGDPALLVSTGSRPAEKKNHPRQQNQRGRPSVLTDEPEPVTFRVNGVGLGGRRAMAVLGNEVTEVARAGAEPGMVGRESQCVPLKEQTEIERGFGSGIFFRAGPGLDGDRIRAGFFHPLERPGSLIEQRGGGEGGSGEEENADFLVRSGDGLGDGPSDQANEKDSQPGAGGVRGETRHDGRDAEERKAGRDKMVLADVGVHRAGEKDAGDGQPVGHVVRVGKNPVGGGHGEGERPALRLKNQGEDAGGGDQPPVGAKNRKTTSFPLGISQNPTQDEPARGEEKKGFQGNARLDRCAMQGNRGVLLKDRGRSEKNKNSSPRIKITRQGGGNRYKKNA